jgi:hypothetical protein
MKSILISIFLAILSGCSSHAYYNEAMRYMEVTKEVLIESGICKDPGDCTKKEAAFWTAGGWKVGPFAGGGVTITLYRVSNLQIAQKVIDKCKALHNKIPNVPVQITVYSNKRDESSEKLLKVRIS